jgi:hypothetical protein
MNPSIAVPLAGLLAAAAQEDAAARLGGKPISLAEVDEEAGARLLALRSQEYALRRQALEQVLAARLLEDEATQRDELQRARASAAAAASSVR